MHPKKVRLAKFYFAYIQVMPNCKKKQKMKNEKLILILLFNTLLNTSMEAQENNPILNADQLTITVVNLRKETSPGI
jgi:hypothetical protein